MKRMIWCAGMVILMTSVATAQKAPHKNAAKKDATTSNNTSAQNTNVEDKTVNDSDSFSSFGSYGAKAYIYKPSSGTAWYIADPTIRAINKKAFGMDTTVSNFKILGVPKRAYGVADGHLIFRSTGATNFGTITGSGGVGTGSSAGSAGAGNQVLGVNGKSPYAGPGMWGTKVAGKEIKPDNTTIRDIKVPKKD